MPRTTERVTTTGDNQSSTGLGQRRLPINHPHHSKNPSTEIQPAIRGIPETATQDRRRLTGHNTRNEKTDARWKILIQL